MEIHGTPDLPPPARWWATAGAVALVLVAIHAWRADLAHSPLSGDRPIFVSIAQECLRGGLPHERTFDHKPPGYPVLCAAAIAVGRVVGADDVIADRVLTTVGLGTLMLLAAGLAQRLRAPSWTMPVAAAALGTAANVAVCSVLGGEPKIGMLVCGLAAMLCFMAGRPLAAGIAVGLAAAFWQPGGLFVLAVVSHPGIMAEGRAAWRVAARAVAGFALPWAMLAVVYGLLGALVSLWDQVLVFNAGYMRNQFPASGVIHHLTRIVSALDLTDRIALIAGLAGWVAWTMCRRSAAALGPLLVIAGFVALSTVNHQGPADFLPLQVLGSVGIPLGLAALINARARWLGMAVAALAVVAGVVRAATYPVWTGPPRLEDQRAVLEPIARHLEATGGSVWCAGVPELLVLFDLPNSTPYTYLHSAAYRMLERREGVPLWRFVHERVVVHGDLVLIDRLPASFVRSLRAQLEVAEPRVEIRTGRDIPMTWRPDALVIFSRADGR